MSTFLSGYEFEASSGITYVVDLEIDYAPPKAASFNKRDMQWEPPDPGVLEVTGLNIEDRLIYEDGDGFNVEYPTGWKLNLLKKKLVEELNRNHLPEIVDLLNDKYAECDRD